MYYQLIYATIWNLIKTIYSLTSNKERQLNFKKKDKKVPYYKFNWLGPAYLFVS